MLHCSKPAPHLSQSVTSLRPGNCLSNPSLHLLLKNILPWLSSFKNSPTHWDRRLSPSIKSFTISLEAFQPMLKEGEGDIRMIFG
ncbi:hypothetical protein Y1Q_0003193 [Alligator mississippiensis]|uniref:Uncharacterized protein n=1 Tax=Alligator mississippiensis TaxID=8496 RepID=A0A151MDV7_ALLMI|nr:hypothetical protein Y1Q_0003193 [Alligator mississippiensis]